MAGQSARRHPRYRVSWRAAVAPVGGAAGQASLEGWVDEVSRGGLRFVCTRQLPSGLPLHVTTICSHGTPKVQHRIELIAEVVHCVLSGHQFVAGMRILEFVREEDAYVRYLLHQERAAPPAVAEAPQASGWRAFLTPADEMCESKTVFGWVNQAAKNELGFHSTTLLTEHMRVHLSVLTVTADQQTPQRVDLLAEVISSEWINTAYQSRLRVLNRMDHA